jgi:hypothetical protein
MLKTVVAAVALCFATPAFADEPKFEYGKHEEVAKVKGTEYSASAEAGIVLTTGNSETTTVSGGFKVARKKAGNKLAFEGSATYARSGGRALLDRNGNGLIDDASEIVSRDLTTAETLNGKARYDRFLTEFNSLFVAALASRDIPAGKKLVAGAQLGYSRRLHKTKTAEAVGEFGIDYSHEALLIGDPNEIISARAFVGLKSELTEGTTFETSGELLTNLNEETLATGADGSPLQDTRFNFKAAVSAKVGKNLAFSASIESRDDRRPAPLALDNLAPGFVPEASALDTIMKASLIYTFL